MKFHKVAVYAPGSTDLNDAKALCMTPDTDPNLIDRTAESADLLEEATMNWMWKDGKNNKWVDQFEVNFRKPVNTDIDDAHPLEMNVNTNYKIFMSIYFGDADGTDTAKVRCGENDDGTPIF